MTNKSNELPETPIAYDAYRHWDRWSQLRIGVRATMRSTRDRSGGNETVCGNHFLYQESADSNVVAESLDPGKMADPVVSYTTGDTVCELTYTAPAPGDTVTVRVILTDDGGSEFGGTNATEVLLKFTEDGAVLASPPDSDGDGIPDT